jgi:predicted glycosyl hydrolase (DUF1957 family)
LVPGARQFLYPAQFTADGAVRFGRDAEGMWLPETAVDDETLVVLAEEGVKFTILAPQQEIGRAHV